MSSTKLQPEPGPLRYRPFRAIWMAMLAASLGAWVQNVGAAWLMTSLTTSPVMIALTQAATTIPAFLLGMPAGVLADSMDKRRLLLAAHCWMLASSILFCILLMLDAINPVRLLIFTLLLGSGSAVSVPAWQSSTAEAVPRSALLSAIALNGVAFNGARAVGPALAGAVIAGIGLYAVFALTTGLFAVAVTIFLLWYKPKTEVVSKQERLVSAMRVGVRYVLSCVVLRGHLVRTLTFVVCASALWALLPIVAKNNPALGDGGYGTMLASLGAGAVVGGIALGRVRRYLALNTLVWGASVLFGIATLIAAYVQYIAPVCLSLLVGGAAWITFNSTVSSAFQAKLPAWVRARALAVFLLTFQGSMALGALIWGVCADQFGVAKTLTAAALLMLAGPLLLRRHPVRMEAELMPPSTMIESQGGS
ncbi:MFS transporter [Paraburkholderia atlantica]|uniref:MFS transporter n=1 Tax=Paraburkholderia atlantica TaxID=2654982 RepID=UPI0026E0A27F|nr:MFS transporter [Paraburkholderia atlantica]